MTCFQ